MKKAITILLSAIVLLFASCPTESPDPGAQPTDANLTITGDKISGTVSEAYKVSATQTIELSGLESGVLYGIYPTSTSTGSSSARDIAPPVMIPTGGKTYLHLSDGRTLSFQPWDMGIEDSGELRFVRYAPTAGDMKIDTDSDTPLYTNESGQRVFEEHYHIVVDELNLDRANVALLRNPISKEVKNVSTSAGLLVYDELKSQPGLMDLRYVDSIDLFNQVKIESGTYTQELFLVNPTTATAEPKTLSAPLMCLVEASDKARVLEIGLGDNKFSDFDLTTNMIQAVYADVNGGDRKNQVAFKLDNTNNTISVYVPADADRVLIPVTVRNEGLSDISVSLRDVTDGDSSVIKTWKPGESASSTIELNNNFFTLVLIEGNEADLAGATITASYDNSNMGLTIVCRNTEKKTSAAQYLLLSGKPCTLSQALVPEYILVSNAASGGKLNLQFSKAESTASI